MEAEDNAETPPDKPRRGRPPGRRNKPVLAQPILVPPSTKPGLDFADADVDSIVARQLSMVSWAQQALRNEMMRAYQAKGVSISFEDIEKLEKMSNAIVRSVDGLKKASDLAEELATRLSPQQLLDAAMKKIQGQDRATLRRCIRQLRQYLEQLGPVTNNDKKSLGETAAGAIAALAAHEDKEEPE